MMNVAAARQDSFRRHLLTLPDPKYNTGQILQISYIYIKSYVSVAVWIKICVRGRRIESVQDPKLDQSKVSFSTEVFPRHQDSNMAVH